MRDEAVYSLGGVSIHAPREGCDDRIEDLDEEPVRFQFTHPGRGATAKTERAIAGTMVSIHAPREGCDSFAGGAARGFAQFQFTHPGRGAT